MTVKVLVLGPGGREHAIIRSLLRDPAVTAVHAAPGNAGIAQLVPTHPIDANSPQAVLTLAEQLRPDLVVIGPEAPLAAGVSDALRAAGFVVFGPSQAAAQLEASKAFAKEVMAAANVPTAMAKVATDTAEAEAALDAFGPPYVVKDDGLAAGKGVVVTVERAEALAHAQACFAAGGQVVIEEYLDGPEVSLFVISDGVHAVPLEPAQDFKRIHDRDEGPNTGGMGAYTPLGWAPKGLVEEVMERVARPTLAEMAKRGTPFVGVLYVGLALTSRGPRVVEFNARFGDPETQAVLERLKSGLGQLLYAAATGKLSDHPALQWDRRAAISVVLASANYPEAPHTGDVITGLEAAAGYPEVAVLHAGTAKDQSGAVVSAGGRVLAVAALGEDLTQARQRAYGALQEITLPGGQFRTDIALKASRGEVAAAKPSEVPELEGYRHVYSGKVRELYEPLDPERSGEILVVATDRISAFDYVLSSEIPDKGKILTQLSLWWFKRLGVPNHVLSTDVPDAVAGRALICQKLDMYPIEAIARGYLTGSGYQEYVNSGTVAGVSVEPGLVDGSPLPQPLYTPSAKAQVGEHDENITYQESVERVGGRVAEALRDQTLRIYRQAEEIARERGIVLADTKFEFGADPVSGELILGDEVLTPDSSRFWDAQGYAPGGALPSFDKQYVRDWLKSAESGWIDTTTAPPALPPHIVEKTRERYIQAYEQLTGESWPAS